VSEKRLDENADPPIQLNRTVINRPPAGVTSTEHTIPGLPSVNVLIKINARPSADGSGTIQAAGSVEVKIPQRGTVDLLVTLASTIQSVSIVGGALPVPIGNNVALTASAFDSAGSVVLTTPGKWQWSVADKTVADGNPAGDKLVLNAKKVGSTNVTAIDSESGKQKTITVKVITVPNGLEALVGTEYHGWVRHWRDGVIVPGDLNEMRWYYKKDSSGYFVEAYWIEGGFTGIKWAEKIVEIGPNHYKIGSGDQAWDVDRDLVATQTFTRTEGGEHPEAHTYTNVFKPGF
jgi:hypothetical protein